MRNPKSLLDKLKEYNQKPKIIETTVIFGILIQYFADVDDMHLVL